MQYSDKFLRLKNEYTAERSLDVSDDQFAALVYTFPSVLVANADGTIDTDEKSFIKTLPEALTEDFIDEADEDVHVTSTLKAAYFTEVSYLQKNLSKWENKFLEALREQLHGSINERNAIFEMMWRTADSSEDISEEEKDKIGYISDFLSL